MADKCVGNGSFKRMFGETKITPEDALRLEDICKKIRGLDITALSKNSLYTAHDILTGGATFPTHARSAGDHTWQIYSEIDKITSNPPKSRGYITKLEKVYQTLRLK